MTIFRIVSSKKKELPVELTIWDSDLGTTQVAKISLPLFPQSSKKAAKTRTGLEVKRARAEIRAGANQKSPLVAFAKKGAVLLADRRLGKWYRVRAGKDSLGWINAELVKKVSARKAKAAGTGNLVPFHQFTPPSIHIDKTPSIVKDDTSLMLSGRVDDDDRDIRDVAVWIGDDKVYLQSGAQEKNPRSVPFNVKVKLKPGPNFITVMAREGDKYSVTKSLVVTRPGGLDWKDEKEKLADGSDPSLILE